MQEELNRIIELTKKKYNISEEKSTRNLYLIVHNDGSEYIQECDEDDLYGLCSENCHIIGDDIQWGGYKAIIKLY